MPLSDTPPQSPRLYLQLRFLPEDTNCEIIFLTFTVLPLSASSSCVVTFPPPSLFLFLFSTLFDLLLHLHYAPLDNCVLVSMRLCFVFFPCMLCCTWKSPSLSLSLSLSFSLQITPSPWKLAGRLLVSSTPVWGRPSCSTRRSVRDSRDTLLVKQRGLS